MCVLAGLLAGCGGDGREDAKSTQTQTTADAGGAGRLTLAALKTLNSADDDVQESVEAFQDDISDCTDVADVGSCVGETYVPMGEALDDILIAIDAAQSDADQDCAERLETVEDSAQALQQVSEDMRDAFVEDRSDDADVDGWASAFEQYRSDMDSALAECGKDTGAVVTTDEADASAAQEDADATVNESSADDEATSYDERWWLQNNIQVQRFCVSKLGARIGKQQPPTDAMRARKNAAILRLRLVARDTPNATIDGKPLESILLELESTLTRGDCDPDAAKRVQRTIDALEGGDTITISEAEKSAAVAP